MVRASLVLLLVLVVAASVAEATRLRRGGVRHGKGDGGDDNKKGVGASAAIDKAKDTLNTLEEKKKALEDKKKALKGGIDQKALMDGIKKNLSTKDKEAGTMTTKVNVQSAKFTITERKTNFKVEKNIVSEKEPVPGDEPAGKPAGFKGEWDEKKLATKMFQKSKDVQKLAWVLAKMSRMIGRAVVANPPTIACAAKKREAQDKLAKAGDGTSKPVVTMMTPEMKIVESYSEEQAILAKLVATYKETGMATTKATTALKAAYSKIGAKIQILQKETNNYHLGIHEFKTEVGRIKESEETIAAYLKKCEAEKPPKLPFPPMPKLPSFDTLDFSLDAQDAFVLSGASAATSFTESGKDGAAKLEAATQVSKDESVIISPSAAANIAKDTKDTMVASNEKTAIDAAKGKQQKQKEVFMFKSLTSQAARARALADHKSMLDKDLWGTVQADENNLLKEEKAALHMMLAAHDQSPVDTAFVEAPAAEKKGGQAEANKAFDKSVADKKKKLQDMGANAKKEDMAKTGEKTSNATEAKALSPDDVDKIEECKNQREEIQKAMKELYAARKMGSRSDTAQDVTATISGLRNAVSKGAYMKETRDWAIGTDVAAKAKAGNGVVSPAFFGEAAIKLARRGELDKAIALMDKRLVWIRSAVKLATKYNLWASAEIHRGTTVSTTLTTYEKTATESAALSKQAVDLDVAAVIQTMNVALGQVQAYADTVTNLITMVKTYMSTAAGLLGQFSVIQEEFTSQCSSLTTKWHAQFEKDKVEYKKFCSVFTQLETKVTETEKICKSHKKSTVDEAFKKYLKSEDAVQLIGELVQVTDIFSSVLSVFASAAGSE
eukprot:g722.t1